MSFQAPIINGPGPDFAVFENGFKEEVLGLQFLEKNTSSVPKIIIEGIFNNSIYFFI